MSNLKSYKKEAQVLIVKGGINLLVVVDSTTYKHAVVAVSHDLRSEKSNVVLITYDPKTAVNDFNIGKWLLPAVVTVTAAGLAFGIVTFFLKKKIIA